MQFLKDDRISMSKLIDYRVKLLFFFVFFLSSGIAFILHKMYDLIINEGNLYSSLVHLIAIVFLFINLITFCYFIWNLRFKRRRY